MQFCFSRLDSWLPRVIYPYSTCSGQWRPSRIHTKIRHTAFNIVLGNDQPRGTKRQRRLGLCGHPFPSTFVFFFFFIVVPPSCFLSPLLCVPAFVDHQQQRQYRQRQYRQRQPQSDASISLSHTHRHINRYAKERCKLFRCVCCSRQQWLSSQALRH